MENPEVQYKENYDRIYHILIITTETVQAEIATKPENAKSDKASWNP
jgi:hypothetical protein